MDGDLRLGPEDMAQKSQMIKDLFHMKGAAAP